MIDFFILLMLVTAGISVVGAVSVLCIYEVTQAETRIDRFLYSCFLGTALLTLAILILLFSAILRAGV